MSVIVCPYEQIQGLPNQGLIFWGEVYAQNKSLFVCVCVYAQIKSLFVCVCVCTNPKLIFLCVYAQIKRLPDDPHGFFLLVFGVSTAAFFGLTICWFCVRGKRFWD
jgi:hypothetical protein